MTNPQLPLEYKFIAPKTATYWLAMRMLQRLEGEAEDKCNDVFIRMEGDFVSGNNEYTTEDFKSYISISINKADKLPIKTFSSLDNSIKFVVFEKDQITEQ